MNIHVLHNLMYVLNTSFKLSEKNKLDMVVHTYSLSYLEV